MKKIYYIPTTSVVVINVHQMLAASNPNVGIDTGAPGIDAGDVETRQKNQGFGGGLWSDMQ